MNYKKNKKITFIIGATASGKTNYALKMAKKNNAVIISADSRQIYKGMEIFSGISEEEKGKILLTSFLSSEKFFSAGEFKQIVEKEIKKSFKKNKEILIVGGTTFYFESILYNNFLPKVEINLNFRKKKSKLSLEDLAEDLKKKDKDRFKTIDKNNKQRIIRALEIIEKIGKVPKNNKEIRSGVDFKVIWIKQDFETQKKNIEKNFKNRMKSGFLNEALEIKFYLNKYFLKQNKNLKSDINEKVRERFFNLGLGYKHIFKLWDNEISEKEFVMLSIKEEQKYAKRQNTYIKKFFNKSNLIVSQIIKLDLLKSS